MAGAIEECLPLSGKPVLAYVSPHAPEVAALLTRRGVPAFAAVEGCTAALALFPACDKADAGQVVMR